MLTMPAQTELPATEAPWTLRLHIEPRDVDAQRWDALLAAQDAPTPFMRHAYLAAMQDSGSAVKDTGWQAVWFTLHAAQVKGQTDEDWQAACVLYVKSHSYGEYVFDWAWADAYARHGLDYYPKAVIAVPFTPVPGSRLLAPDALTRQALLAGVQQWCEEVQLSSLHLLFGSEADMAAAQTLGLMQRQTVQFHWQNPQSPQNAHKPASAQMAEEQQGSQGQGAMRDVRARSSAESAPDLAQPVALGSLHLASLADPASAAHAGSEPAAQPASDRFAAFLATLQRDKRKKIQQERRRVRDAGVSFRVLQGAQISEADWAFFYRCYAQTYWEHGNAPYLTLEFFAAMRQHMPEAWLLFIAERGGEAVACSLIGLQYGDEDQKILAAYGRYWGAIEHVDCLHFEACYYQPLEWCLAHDVARFEGGAQGEHKMARALMPVATHSAHWLARPDFADAVARFLAREGEGVSHYMDELAQRTPFAKPGARVAG